MKLVAVAAATVVGMVVVAVEAAWVTKTLEEAM